MMLSSIGSAVALAAQAQPGGPEMRQFWHVFAAYAVAWVLLFGWVASILRRLKKVEEKLDS
ncbi:MAG: CcmD family protein [Gemmatimonadetes bacterium]|nr:CcmD family protein [Gemmatimonadota bacterium]